MKYYKKDNKIYGYTDNQLYLVTDDMIELSPLEIDKIINPQNHLSVSEIENSRLNNMPPLTRRQFKLTLLDNNILDQVEHALNGIQDPYLKKRVKIEYDESPVFLRNSNTIMYMSILLNLSSEQLDALWAYGLSQ